MDLFNESRRLPLSNADVIYHPQPNLGIDPHALFVRLRKEIAWEQHSVQIDGKVIPQPRLSSWYGNVVHGYSTLAHVLHPHPFTELLQGLLVRVQALSGAKFNSMLANLYRDGGDAIGWHSDSEPELGPEPVIASLSLGEERRFDLRLKTDHSTVSRITLEHGSLLVMGTGTQRHWQHSIARTTKPIGERINLTFRLTEGRNNNSALFASL